MSMYTTGEIAKLCNVTVRTVQYYDTKGILIPSELTDGGRRLYSEDDLKKMKVICFLRDLDISINNIQDILKEEHPNNVIELLLKKQQDELQFEIDEKQEKLDKLVELNKIISKTGDLDLSSIGDAAKIMANKKELFKIRRNMILIALPFNVLEWVAIALWIIKGIWWPFVVSLILMIPVGIIISFYYMKRVKYICPECHTNFMPKKSELFWANHTPNTRKLTCPCCNKKRWCVETYNDDLLKEKKA